MTSASTPVFTVVFEKSPAGVRVTVKVECPANTLVLPAESDETLKPTVLLNSLMLKTYGLRISEQITSIL